MKKLLALVLALVMVLSLAACGAKTDAPAAAPEAPKAETPAETPAAPAETPVEEEPDPVTIYYCNYAVLETAHTAYWEQLIADFEAEYPYINVEVLSAAYNDVLTYATTRVGGGEPIDLMYGEVTWNQVLASNGLTSPITEILGDDVLSQYEESMLNCFEYEGEIYGLPTYTSNLIVYANKNYLEQAGLDYTNPPKTTAELMQWCEALQGVKNPNSGEQVTAFGISMAEKTAPGHFLKCLVSAHGGHILDGNGKLDLENEGFKEAVAFVKEMTDKGYSPVNCLPKDFRPGMASGAVAMYVDQTWGYSGTYAVDPNAADYVVSFPVPALGTNGKGATNLSAHTLYMSNNGEAEAAATAKLVKFILDYPGTWEHSAATTPAYYAYGGAADMPLSPVLEGAKSAASNLVSEVYLPEQDAYQIAIATMFNSICMGEATQEEAIAKFTATVSPMLP